MVFLTLHKQFIIVFCWRISPLHHEGKKAMLDARWALLASCTMTGRTLFHKQGHWNSGSLFPLPRAADVSQCLGDFQVHHLSMAPHDLLKKKKNGFPYSPPSETMYFPCLPEGNVVGTSPTVTVVYWAIHAACHNGVFCLDQAFWLAATLIHSLFSGSSWGKVAAICLWLLQMLVRQEQKGGCL